MLLLTSFCCEITRCVCLCEDDDDDEADEDVVNTRTVVKCIEHHSFRAILLRFFNTRGHNEDDVCCQLLFVTCLLVVCLLFVSCLLVVCCSAVD